MVTGREDVIEMTEGRIHELREKGKEFRYPHSHEEYMELLDLAEEGLMARVQTVCARVGRCVSHRANRFEHDESCPVRQYGLTEALRRHDPDTRGTR